LIQKEIVNQLSKRILAGDIDKSHPVLVDVFDLPAEASAKGGSMVVFRNDTPAPIAIGVEKTGKKK